MIRSRARLTAVEAVAAAAELGDKPQQAIARIAVEGEPRDMPLPSSEGLRDRVPIDLATIEDHELTVTPQPVRFDASAFDLASRTETARKSARRTMPILNASPDSP
jgi:hypothetical protein